VTGYCFRYFSYTEKEYGEQEARKVLMFPFATPREDGVFKANN
jgi:hypothetical protein